MSNHRLDYASRKISEAFARANARAKEQRDKQLVDQQEIQSVQEKIQQQLLTMANLKAQIEVFKNADNAVTKTTNANTGKLSDEQYQTIITQKMLTHIKSKGTKQ